MGIYYSFKPLSDALIERQEVPSVEDIDLGQIKIVSKIGFNVGQIELRTDSKTKTKMILIRPGDIVVSGINAAKGAIAIYPDNENQPIAATIHYGSYIVKNDRADIKYLWWLLRSKTFRNILAKELPGGIKTELKAKRLLPIQIPLPPLAEQRRIVARVEELAAKIEEARRLREKAQKEASVFVASIVKDIFDSIVGKPETKTVPLSSVSDIARGKFSFRPRNDPRFYGGNIPFIQIGDISASSRYISNYSQTLNEQGLQISRKFPKGTVVIAITGATVGATGILDIDCCFPDSIVGIQANLGKVTSEYLFWALEYVKKHALAEATQTTQPNINLKILNKLSVPIQSLENQEITVNLIELLIKKREDINAFQTKTSIELEALLPSILDRAFKGEL